MIFSLPRLAGPVIETTDAASALAIYGVAAPFAALCLVLAFLFRKERDSAREELKEAQARIEGLHEEALRREQQLVSGLGPRIYDAALLYREGTRMAEHAATAAGPAVESAERRLDELTRQVAALVEGIQREGP